MGDGSCTGLSAKTTSDNAGAFGAGVVIEVEPEFLEDRSVPAEDAYVWAYTVRIENHRSEAVRLLSRYWRITDARGVVQEVRGDGVVGEQPLIQPGECYEYTSGTPLRTPSGLMSGSYQMETPDGTRFEAEIPAFSLDSPYETRARN
ncbi:MAG: Co2+/Mg2+ efflux protein ApaG [Pseudomonadota bacterium]